MNSKFSNLSLNNRISDYLYTLALFLIIFYFAFSGYYKVYAYSISLLGIMVLLFAKKDVDYNPLFPIMSVFLFVSISDIYNIIMGVTDLSDLEKVVRNSLLVFPFLVFLSKASIKPILILLAGAGLFIVTLFFAILQVYGFYAQDASHFNGKNPGIWFNKGSFSAAVVLFFALFSGISLYIKGMASKTLLIISYLAVFWLLYLNQARGPLLAFTFISIFILIFFVEPLIKSKGKFALSLISISVFCVYVLFSVFGDRFSQGINELVEHFSIGSQYTSVSIRLDTWQLAWDVFIENPLFGAGAQGVDVVKASIIDSGKYPEYILKYHAHSEYFMTLERGGVFGFFGLLWMLFFPFYHLRKSGVEYRGMYPIFLVVGSFLIIGITSATLRNNIGANSFILCLLLSYFFSYKYLRRESA